MEIDDSPNMNHPITHTDQNPHLIIRKIPKKMSKPPMSGVKPQSKPPLHKLQSNQDLAHLDNYYVTEQENGPRS